jgi:hypothetical protein
MNVSVVAGNSLDLAGQRQTGAKASRGKMNAFWRVRKDQRCPPLFSVFGENLCQAPAAKAMLNDSRSKTRKGLLEERKEIGHRYRRRPRNRDRLDIALGFFSKTTSSSQNQPRPHHILA